METLDALTTLFGVINIFAFVFYNKYRLHKIITFLAMYTYNNSNTLQKRQISDLLSNYTSFFGYLLGFPNKKSYKYLYLNMNFNMYYQRCKLFNYYFLSSLFIFVVLKVYFYNIFVQ